MLFNHGFHYISEVDGVIINNTDGVIFNRNNRTLSFYRGDTLLKTIELIGKVITLEAFSHTIDGETRKHKLFKAHIIDPLKIDGGEILNEYSHNIYELMKRNIDTIKVTITGPRGNCITIRSEIFSSISFKSKYFKVTEEFV